LCFGVFIYLQASLILNSPLPPIMPPFTAKDFLSKSVVALEKQSFNPFQFSFPHTNELLYEIIAIVNL